MATPGTSERHPVRTVMHFLVGNWPARIYLLVVAAAIAFGVISTATYSGADANFALVWTFFATAPWSLVLIGLVPMSAEGGTVLAAMITIVVLSALANLATIGWLLHLIRRDPTLPPSAARPGPGALPQR